MIKLPPNEDFEILSRKIRKRLLNDWDIVIAVEGEEGSGKSDFALHLGMCLDKNFDLEKNVAYMPSFKETEDKFNKLKRYSAYVMDEAIKVLYKMYFWHKLQQKIVEMYGTERKQNKCTILCIPRFIDLNENFRNHRVKIRVRIIDRGHAVVYARDPDKDIKDPWHLKQNLHIKKRILRKKVSERTFGEMLAAERRTINYIFDFKFDKLPEEIWEEYKDKVRYHKTLKPEEDDSDDTMSKIEKFKMALAMTLHYIKEENPKITLRQLSNITGLHFTTVGVLLKRAEKEMK